MTLSDREVEDGLSPAPPFYADDALVELTAVIGEKRVQQVNRRSFALAGLWRRSPRTGRGARPDQGRAYPLRDPTRCDPPATIG